MCRPPREKPAPVAGQSQSVAQAGPVAPAGSVAAPVEEAAGAEGAPIGEVVNLERPLPTLPQRAKQAAEANQRTAEANQPTAEAIQRTAQPVQAAEEPKEMFLRRGKAGSSAERLSEDCPPSSPMVGDRPHIVP
jgi:hypothetical protein